MKWLAPIAGVVTENRATARRPAMHQIAIDLGGRESQICVRSDDGTIIKELRYHTAALGGWLATMPASRVILETCAESFAVAVVAAVIMQSETRNLARMRAAM